MTYVCNYCAGPYFRLLEDDRLECSICREIKWERIHVSIFDENEEDE